MRGWKSNTDALSRHPCPERRRARATRLAVPAPARQQPLAIVGNTAAFIARLDQVRRELDQRRSAELASRDSASAARLDQLYRAQIAAKDGEIAAKDELIVEL